MSSITLNETFLQALPHQLQAKIAEALTKVSCDDPINICINGAFSSGKSSLLNMLIDRDLLPVALEECTALPTFLEYDQTESFFLLDANGDVQTVDFDVWHQAIIKPTAGLTSALAKLPLPWLTGLRLIDLPGLNSTDERNQDFSLAQMRAADAVIYIFPESGGNVADKDSLTLLYSLGKTIFLGIGKWDLIEAAKERGEQIPNLAEWSHQIATTTGVRSTLVPLSRLGHGRNQILDFLQACQTEKEAHRKSRVKREVEALLLNFNSECQAKLEILHQESDQNADKQRDLCLEQQKSLLDLKSNLHTQEKNEQIEILKRFDEETSATATWLTEQTKSHCQSELSKLNWNHFLKQGTQLLREALTQEASLAEALSGKFGKIVFPPAETKICEIPFVPPAPVNATDFLDQAQLLEMEQEVSTSLAMAEEADHVPQYTKDVSTKQKQLEILEREYRELKSQSHNSADLTGKNRSGRIVGRLVGEILDIGLVLYNPFFFLSKGSALATESMEQHEAKISSEASPEKPKALKAISYLKKLSFAYWGERLGSRFDNVKTIEEDPSPAMVAEQEDRLQALKYQIELMEAEIAALNIKASQGDPEVYRSRAAQLEKSIKNMRKRAEEERALHQAMQDKDTLAMLRYVQDKAINQWSQAFQRQSDSMRNELLKVMKTWWDKEIEQRLNSKEQQLTELLDNMNKGQENVRQDLQREQKACMALLKDLESLS